MTRSAPRTPALEHSADRAPRHSVQRLVRRCAHAKNPTFSIHFRSVSKSAPSRISSDWLGQLANAKLPELDRRAFRFQTEISAGRPDVGAAGHFLAVDPQTHFAIDASDIIMVPFTDTFAQVFRWETAFAVRRHRRKRLHGRGAGGEDIAVGGEPVGLLFGLLRVLLGITVVEYLHLDAGRKPPVALFQRLD